MLPIASELHDRASSGLLCSVRNDQEGIALLIPQSNIDLARSNFAARLGQPYGYGGAWSATDLTEDTDCSGLVGETLEALVHGPAMLWGRTVSTESWPYNYGNNTPAATGTVGPYGTIAVASLADVPADAVAVIAIHHGGGGVDSHTNISVQGYLMEDSGDKGVCDAATGAIPQTDSYWTDWWYLGGGVGAVPRGVDYAGGRIPGADVLAAGFSFALRYLAPGGDSLPSKQLTPDEAANDIAAGLGLVSNWESTGVDAEQGFAAGVADAQASAAQHALCGGPANRPIFFSLDWDEDDSQDTAVFAYFQGVASIIGLARTGAYGGYWIIKRLFDAGLITWGWQTEAWSSDPNHLGPDGPDGTYLDPRAQILQRNMSGYAYIDGVQCDINEAQTSDYGQWNYTGGGGAFMALTDQQQTDLYNKVVDIYGSQFNPVASSSMFATPGEGAIWNNKQLLRNDDGMIHPIFLSWAAGHGDPASLQELAAIAAQTDPAHAGSAAIAKSVLAELGVVKVLPPVAPTPVPSSADVDTQPQPVIVLPPAPTPVVVAPTPSNSIVTVNKKSVIEGFHTVVTVLSGGLAAGTWIAQSFAHDLSPTWATVISSGLVGLGTAVNWLTREDKKLQEGSN